MKEIANEFKQFIMRGNVIDMAVGIIIGGAFANRQLHGGRRFNAAFGVTAGPGRFFQLVCGN